MNSGVGPPNRAQFTDPVPDRSAQFWASTAHFELIFAVVIVVVVVVA